jgi:threonine dehydrogenase-like Zn-dependent dehydrogenase
MSIGGCHSKGVPTSRTGKVSSYHVRSRRHSVSAPTGLAPTQELGAALHGVAGLEGFLAVSARVPYNQNLVVFPKKLLSGSQISFTDPSGRHHSIP